MILVEKRPVAKNASADDSIPARPIRKSDTLSRSNP
jgi:hypothetical protein